MLKAMLLAFALAFGTLVHAQGPGPERRVVAEVRPLLVEAIDSPNGTAYGRLTGQLAGAIGRQFKTAAPINIDVSTVVHYAEDGCRRLSVFIWQEGILLREGAAVSRQTVEFGINYCRNGLPPRSQDRAEKP